MNIFYFMELSMKKGKFNSFKFLLQKLQIIVCVHCNALHCRDRTLETEQYGASVHPVRQITQMHSPLFQLTCLYAGSKHLDFKIERKIYFTTSESLMFKLRLRLKFQKKTLSIKTRNSPPKKLIKSSGYNEEICTELIKPYVFFHFFHQKIF